ncbi:MAG: GntR family transcriptional regulator [Clostridia bacterium]|nr:GntR family transcriptional regulator [Clostridia bacterium]
MISIDYKDRRSIYEQLVDRIKALIVGGILPSGSQIPSVRQLSAELSINPNTVQRAYSELEREGLIYSVKGRGNFVSEDASLLQRSSQLSLIQKFSESALAAMQAGVPKAELVQVLDGLIDPHEPIQSKGESL